MNRADALFLVLSGFAFSASVFLIALPAKQSALPELPSSPVLPLPQTPPPALDHEPTVWSPPESQSSGPEWVFEVFTPPIIYFDPVRSAFEVTPPAGAKLPVPFALKPLRLERPLYRLQYAAHAGEEGRYIVEIFDRERGDWVRGRPGDSFPESEFRLDVFSVTRVRVPSVSTGETAHFEEAITLVIFDERTGAPVTLTRKPRHDDDWSLRAETPAGPILLTTGDSWASAAHTYIVSELNAAIGEAVIERRCNNASLPAERQTFFIDPGQTVSPDP